MATHKESYAMMVDKCARRIAGFAKHVRPTTEIAIDGTLYEAAEVTAIFQRYLDARAALVARRADDKAALARCREADAVRRATDKALAPWVANRFGANSPQAHEFGFPPPKAREMTVRDKAHAVVERMATRKARHTMGSRQRKAVKGVVVEAGAEAKPPNPGFFAAEPGPRPLG